MEEIIKISEKDGQRAVNARELHAFLESKQELPIGLRDVSTNMVLLRIKTMRFLTDLSKTPKVEDRQSSMRFPLIWQKSCQW